MECYFGIAKRITRISFLEFIHCKIFNYCSVVARTEEEARRKFFIR